MKKARIALTFAIVAGVFLWLTISGFNENLQYYVSIEDVENMGDAAFTKGLRVKGYLVPGSLVKKTNSLEATFVIEDEGHRMRVRYAKELPDTFKDGSEVLVEGRYTPEGYFQAQVLMAKCPSKYEGSDNYDARAYNAGGTAANPNSK